MKLITNLILEKMIITISGESHVNQWSHTATQQRIIRRNIKHKMVIAVLLTR